MRRLNPLIFILTLGYAASFGQTPKVDAVQRIVSYPFSTVIITGSGFSSNAADLQVWFGNVKGTITAASLTSLEVTVPAQARLSNVEVINISSKKSGSSAKKFMPNFSGDIATFGGANFGTQFVPWTDKVFDLCSCDLDGNGKTDLVGSIDNILKKELMIVENTSTVAANNTTLQFTSKLLGSPESAYSVACGDLNGDGKPELVATRGGSVTSINVYIFPNTSSPGTISFGTPVTLNLDAGELGKFVAIHDLNRDGKSDIVISNGANTNTIYIFQNALTSSTIIAGEFTRHKKNIGSTSGALEIQDFSGDGWPDIAMIPFSAGTKFSLLVNPADGTASFSSAQTMSIPVSNSLTLRDMATADFNNDGWMDLVMTDFAAGRSFVFINRQTVNPVSFAQLTASFLTQKPWGIDVADMNGDGFADFVVQGQDVANKQLDIFVHKGTTNADFTKVSLTPPKSGWYVNVGDFDGDSKPDIAAAATDGISALGMQFYKNQNCHKPVILNEDPIVICNLQPPVEVNAVSLQGIAYTWNTGDSGPTATVTSADAPTVTITAVGEGGTCSRQASITVNVSTDNQPAAPPINGPSTICAGETLALTTTATADEYIWEGPNDFMSSVQNPPGITNVTSINGGDYSLRVRVGDCTSDPTIKTVTVVEPTAFTISANPGPQVCSGQAVTLSVANDANYNYQWKKGGSNIVGATSASYAIASAALTDDGNYTVAISHKTILCSSETNAFALDILAAPTASFTKSPSTVCVGTEVTFTNTSTFDNSATVAYDWTFGDGTTSTSSAATVNHTYSNAGPITTSLKITYSGANCSNTSNMNFTVEAATAPTINVENGAIEICGDGTEQLALTVEPDYTTYTWTPTGSGKSITISGPGTYSVVTEAANGCIGNAEVTLTPKAGCEGGPGPPIDIEAMKAFTPNSDGSNDFWGIRKIENYPGCVLNVFDGRGMRVFQISAESYPVYVEGGNSPGWDGIAAGKEVPAGTYFFVLGCPDKDKPFTGAVLIVR